MSTAAKIGLVLAYLTGFALAVWLGAWLAKKVVS